jgi:hypothetical protein
MYVVAPLQGLCIVFFGGQKNWRGGFFEPIGLMGPMGLMRLVLLNEGTGDGYF